MSISIPNFLTQKCYNGLNSYTYTIPSSEAGMNQCRIEVDHRGSSAATISIAQSGSQNLTLATVTLVPVGTAIPSSQSTAIVIASANAAAADVITFTVSSSAAIDQGLNDIKCRIIVTR